MPNYYSEYNTNLKDIFEKQKKELTQSLQYASYIQKALLPNEQVLKRYFDDYFLLYMPRDIVSGDFYWVSRKKNSTYMVIADCTGHGVPGAFLSILGITFLNQVVDRTENAKASFVLNSLREHIMKALHQTGDLSEQKDGIDLSLCVVDHSKHELQFSGAFNSAYIIRNKELSEVPADKMPIGVAAEEERSFTNHVVQLEQDDTIYLFTDGFVDQFGGPDCKKYKYKPFRELLLKLNDKPLDKQKAELRKEHLDWKGEQPQLDDITVFGFRYNK